MTQYQPKRDNNLQLGPLFRDQGVGGSNPLSPTNPFNNLQFWLPAGEPTGAPTPIANYSRDVKPQESEPLGQAPGVSTYQPASAARLCFRAVSWSRLLLAAGAGLFESGLLAPIQDIRRVLALNDVVENGVLPVHRGCPRSTDRK
jgi:hypothetical protein